MEEPSEMVKELDDDVWVDSEVEVDHHPVKRRELC
jgi:hypothetical protein